MTKKPISAEFPFESKYLDVLGSKIHYIEEGEGDPILFLHGNPTCNYLWRNIIPHVSGQGRCIAPDLIGMGKSDKPDIDYGFEDSYSYLEGFINEMGLKNITLVVHDWGSGLGFHYATENPDNIKAIAFMEAIHEVPPIKELPFSVRVSVPLLTNPVIGKFIVGNFNIMVKKGLSDMIIRKLTDEEKAVYEAPYKTKASRKPMWVWPQQIPFDPSVNRPVNKAYIAWRDWLPTSEIPKLCLYVTPGAGIKEKEAMRIRETFTNTEVINVGEGLHFMQEDCPHEIGEALSNWYKKIG